MGAWGVALFSDDTAVEVRDEYKAKLAEGLSGPEATTALLERWHDTVDDEDEGPVFWLALAITQHRLGRLEERVALRATRILEDEAGLHLWRDGTKQLQARRGVLAKVRDELATPPRPLKRIAPRFRDTCAWEAGELISYELPSGDPFVMHVVGIESHLNGESPVCEALDWTGRQPQLAELAGAKRRAGIVPPEVLLRGLAATYDEAGTNPIGAMQQVLAEASLIEAPEQSVDAFDLRHVGSVAQTVEDLRAGHPEVTAKITALARVRTPALLKPVRQFSIRRELKRSELPIKRIQRLNMSLPPIPLADWLVFRWYELDEALHDVFGVS